MTTDRRPGAMEETITDPEAPATVPAENLDDCQAELAEVKDRLLRALADQENFRRRAEREREDAVRFAAAQLVKDLLPTADSLSRALEDVPPGDHPLHRLRARSQSDAGRHSWSRTYCRRRTVCLARSKTYLRETIHYTACGPG